MQARYLVVVGAALTQFVVIGLLFSFGLFIPVLEAEFGWSRTLLSACSSIAFFMMGALALVAGPLADRLGPGRVLAVTGALYGLGWVLLARIGAPWQLVVVFALPLGAGLASHDVVTLGSVARWFEARRGLMTALAKVGTALGQMAVPPLAAALILWLGWRVAATGLGLAAGVLLLAAASVMRRPRDGEVSRGAGQAAPAGAGLGWREARATRAFWTLCAIQALFFPALMTVPFHLALHGMDMGLPAPRAALLLSVIGAASILGRLVVGQGIDRIGGRNAFVLCMGCLLAGLNGLTWAGAPGPLFAAVAVYGMAHGGLFVVISPIVAEYFGMRAHGAIFAAIVFCGTSFAAFGPVLAGAAFDRLGGYFPAFLGLSLCVALALGLILTLPRPDTARAG
ncbi:MFS transporter [Marinibacterium sp. SX1]|uniref:MFS transporter n=1 Tax=Marinibacterium sp. SX1 TaxID=3388424 RepID=UPI003D1658EE